MFTKNVKKKLIPFAVISSLAVAGYAGVSTDTEAKSDNSKKNKNEIENVIFLIGDGMGPSYTTAYRSFMDDKTTPYMEKTAFDEYLVGAQETYSWDPEESVTDSAAAGTAMAAGVKTYNGAISVDVDKNEVKTVLEEAKENKKATGLVSTSQINHATPASFGAHDEDRNNYNDIADDYYDEMINGEHKVDVLLGGGTSYFERSDRNLTEEFQEDGYSYVTSKDELKKDKNKQILGLFAPKGMDKAIDRTEDTPSLEEMTDAALNRLSEDKDGFFLMVEGSQIDWAGHDNDAVAAMSEMEDFEKAYAAAIEFAKKDKHTLVVTTADHSTGGFAMGRDGEYKWDPAPLKAAKKTPDYMAAQIADGSDVEKTLTENIDLDLTSEEIASVKKATETNDVVEIDNAIEKIFDLRSGTGWTTGGHTGVDVNVYAYGPQSEKFAGLHDNNETGQLVMDLLNAKQKGDHEKDDDRDHDNDHHKKDK
ncbi:alkaline phosphatase [Alkalihalobacillus hwajinpoensis]|uniref:alkaline phosphatase n=1 Tax=Guptibacillus hwajinpoensis TaxID=208199 RepID=UPI0018843F49|nr:alkaline phosphatase [Pseudalkalibacillus hwajinpoensis]MBF0707531.1 alkaline phosphatase [Pseudalkalibacillus hwajinpoensis]